MRFVFKILTSVLFLAVVVQVAFAGYGAFDALHKAKSGPVSKHTIESGFDYHGALGSTLLGVLVLLVVVAALGKLGDPWLKWSVGLLVAGVIQLLLGVVSVSVPWLGAVHGIVALVIYAGAGLLTHRAWTQGRRAAAAPAA
ncbi:MAG: hypothetical protein ACYDCH_00660 [Gaiellaceae bacterium]